MAKVIKGITVEIGGNASPLNKALNDVNKTSRSLQSELRTIDKLLKLDPSNVELLTQKQDVLSESIATTEEKLRRLKSAEDKVAQAFEDGKIDAEQYRAFQRNIVTTEQKLNDLKSELNKTSTAITNLGTDAQKSEKKLDDYKKEVDDVKNAVNDFVKEFTISLADGRIEENLSSFSDGTGNLFKKWKDGKATAADVFYSAINDLSTAENKQTAMRARQKIINSFSQTNNSQNNMIFPSVIAQNRAQTAAKSNKTPEVKQINLGGLTLKIEHFENRSAADVNKVTDQFMHAVENYVNRREAFK